MGLDVHIAFRNSTPVFFRKAFLGNYLFPCGEAAFIRLSVELRKLAEAGLCSAIFFNILWYFLSNWWEFFCFLFQKKSVKLFVNSLPFNTQWKMWGFCVGTGVSRFPALTLYAEYILTYRWIGGFFLASFLRTICWIEVIWLYLENPENEVRVKKQSFPVSYFSRNLSWLFFEFQLFQSLFSWNCFIWRLPHGLCRTTADSNSQRYRRNRHVPCITSDTFLTGFLNDFSLHLP